MTPDDHNYPVLKRGFNPRWEAAPDYIRLVSGREETRKALELALAERSEPKRSRITVRSGGHCYENFVSSPDVRVIIDVGLMNRIFYDREMGAVCVEAGASNWDIQEKLMKKLGLMLPGGSCPTVGVGGHIPGGGFGLFSRQFGLTVDYLHAVEVAVVTEKREVRLVTARADDDVEERHELWWAHTGGGGGNFGVVTRFWFRGLPWAPSDIVRAEAGWAWDRMTKKDFQRLVSRFGHFFAEHQGQSGDTYGDLFGILLLTPSNKKQIGLTAQVDAAVPNAENLVKEFVREMDSAVTPDIEHRTEAHGEHPVITGSHEPVRVPWSKLQQVPVLTNDLSGKYKSAYMREPFPDEQVEALWDGLTAHPGVDRDGVVQVDAYGSRVNTHTGDTAVAQRDSIMKVQHQVYWPRNKSGEDELRWIRKLYYAMYRSKGGVPIHDAVTDGCYINYPDVDLNDHTWNTSGVSWAELYYHDDYPRLREVKKMWDPHNVFHHEQSIEPT
ncbi:FAD-binding oxidoreductase [Halostreptopolyspora alba]|uniref:FAD-binding oxidoreductase n=1 Tax=Halostreptopolyspora alba TaxID=2487137 RepID=A0A3N0EII1_9ACTN|nr:FAD-binding oxidoreductase [Nocardiopsaceae bacterium YIM 96095]